MTAPQADCKRCGRPLKEPALAASVFEGMHWLCFHLEFEHDADPDEECFDPGCPWWLIRTLKEKLVELGEDPSGVLDAAVLRRYATDQS